MVEDQYRHDIWPWTRTMCQSASLLQIVSSLTVQNQFFFSKKVRINKKYSTFKTKG